MRDIARERYRLPASRVDQPNGLPRCVGSDIGDRDAGALSGKGERRRAADPPAAPRDQRGFSVEQAGHHLLPIILS